MIVLSPLATTAESESAAEDRAARLIRSNEALRAEVHRLARENAELSQRLADALAGSQTDRDVRRAALNLLEDAQNARQAELRESQERRRVEEELRKANRCKDEFLATLAHELRNPLAPIRNSLHILRLAGLDNAATEHVREMLERQVNHLIRLVDDLLEVSRITVGRIELRTEPVELAGVIASALETSKPLIDAARHQLDLKLPAEPLTPIADSVRLSQVLSNLLNNAAKYTQDGGQIWLTARREGSSAVVSVRDSGEGIPLEMLPRLFELFTQIDRTIGRAKGGLGIGLSLARTLVEAHGGTIEARSEGPGRGSEFIVRLPLADAAVRAPSSPACNDTPTGLARRRILVVDDNRDAAESLAMLLRHASAEVRTVFDGAAALEEIPSFRPDVILLDIGMPEMDGHEVARRLRALPEGRDVLLIALTGWGQDDDCRRSCEAGFDHHLVKPVELSVLNELLVAPR
jgi:signal transduction histidine kinase